MIYVDETTIIAIIKFQALVRGYLTRKLIFEHLQQIVSQQQQNEQEFEQEQKFNRFLGVVLENDLIMVKEAYEDEEGCSTDGADFPDNDQVEYKF